MRVDVHSHFYPKEHRDMLVAMGREDMRNAPVTDPDLSGRIAEQDRHGVDCQVLSYVGRGDYHPDPAAATAAAQCVNDIYRDVCQRYPGRFRYFAMVPLPHVPQAIAEAQRASRDPNCIGIVTACSVNAMPIDHPDFEPFWEAMNASGACIYIHPAGQDSRCHWGLDSFGLDAMFGSSLQLGITACRIVFSGLSRRYPRLRFVLAHFGGFLVPRWEAIQNIVIGPGLAGHAPYMLGWVKDLDLDPADPMAGFRKLLYDTSGAYHMPHTLQSVHHAYGADRLVLGSDTPFMSLGETVTCISHAHHLSDGQKCSILDERGAGLFCC